MKIAFIGTYTPRECGIGTFTKNLVDSVVCTKTNSVKEVEGFVVAMNDYEQDYPYPEEVEFKIQQDHQTDYLEAANYINLSGADLCILQHEFGIFGGQSGVYILPLLHRLTIPFVVFVWIYNALPWRMSLNWWTLIPCYILFDFCSYWTHNISHRVRFFWATHVVHHSSTHFNLTVSFRLSWMQYIKIIFIFPVALMGFHPVIIFFTSQVAVLFQFWVHTEYIRKLHPFIEYILATPSNHRVHHGSQSKYINKNYGATFVIWDRIFNTYQKEEEQAHYGITEDITEKSNPIHINFHEYGNILRDISSTKSWKRKWFYLFGDPGKIAAMTKREDVS